jgi:hypothetical protein
MSISPSAAIARHLATPLAQALRALFVKLDHTVPTTRPIKAYVAGGIAVHLYTGARVTHDVDAEFDAARLYLPETSVPIGDAAAGDTLFLDLNYNPAFALLHADHQEAALPLDLGTQGFLPHVLHPLDLSTSKLTRWAEIDRADIDALAHAGLIDADGLARRAEEALAGLVTDPRFVVLNIRDAVARVRAIEATRRQRLTDP